jgi:hypothetical protein
MSSTKRFVLLLALAACHPTPAASDRPQPPDASVPAPLADVGSRAPLDAAAHPIVDARTSDEATPEAGGELPPFKHACTASTCDLAREACCENVVTGAYRCLLKGSVTDFKHCGLGNEWAFVMSCAEYTDCPRPMKCCQELMLPPPHPARLFTDEPVDPGDRYLTEPQTFRMRSTCATECWTDEVCRANGRCKGYWGCATDPDARTGGSCKRTPASRKRPAQRLRRDDAGTARCPDLYVVGIGAMVNAPDDYCALLCKSNEDCGTNDANARCFNDTMWGTRYCHSYADEFGPIP